MSLAVAIARGDNATISDTVMIPLDTPIDVADPIEQFYGPPLEGLYVRMDTETLRSLSTQNGYTISAKNTGASLNIASILSAQFGSQAMHFSSACVGDLSYIVPRGLPLLPVHQDPNRSSMIVVRALRVGTIRFANSSKALSNADVRADVGALVSKMMPSNSGTSPTLKIEQSPTSIDCKNLDTAALQAVSSPATTSSTSSASATPKGKSTAKSPAKNGLATTKGPTGEQAAPSPSAPTSAGTSSLGRTITALVSSDRHDVTFVFGSGINLVAAVEVWQVTNIANRSRSWATAVPTTDAQEGVDIPLNSDQTAVLTARFYPLEKHLGCAMVQVTNNTFSSAAPRIDSGGGVVVMSTPFTTAYCPPRSHVSHAPVGYTNKQLGDGSLNMYPQEYYDHDPRNLTFDYRQLQLNISKLYFVEDAHYVPTYVYGPLTFTDTGYSITRRSHK